MSSGNGMFLTGSPDAPKLVVFCPSGICCCAVLMPPAVGFPNAGVSRTLQVEHRPVMGPLSCRGTCGQSSADEMMG